MKLAIVSDLHLEFRPAKVHWHKLAEIINSQEVDLVINAGDTHPDRIERNFFNSLIKLPYVEIYGNHDFYGKQHPCYSRFIEYKYNLKIAGCTLWTDFNKHDPIAMVDFPNILADGRQIVPNHEFKTLADELYEMNKQDLKFLDFEKPDIVVTHHAPSFKSVHPKFYHTKYFNNYFMSDFDNFILDNPKIQYWFHGHMHDPVDYMIGTTHVLANPLGYPSEHYRNVADYKPLIVEV